MTTRENFESQLDARPDDWELRSIYADWLEEQGDAFCETQRWMVANEKSPDKDESTWDWWSPKFNVLCGDLTPLVFNELLGGRLTSYRFIEYATRLAAELDLHNALVKAGEIQCTLIERTEA